MMVEWPKLGSIELFTGFQEALSLGSRTRLAFEAIQLSSFVYKILTPAR